MERNVVKDAFLSILCRLHRMPLKRSIHWLGHVRQLGAQILAPAHAPGISWARALGGIWFGKYWGTKCVRRGTRRFLINPAVDQHGCAQRFPFCLHHELLWKFLCRTTIATSLRSTCRAERLRFAVYIDERKSKNCEIDETSRKRERRTRTA